MSIVGKTYLERGEPITVVARWAPPATVGSSACPSCGRTFTVPKGGTGVYCGCRGWDPPVSLSTARRQGPRNVLIRRFSGELVVRPFRGLRAQR